MKHRLLLNLLVLRDKYNATPEGDVRPAFQKFILEGDPMKALHLLLAVCFTCTLCLSVASSEVLAATDKKEISASTDKTTVVQKSVPDENKKVAKIKKEVPRNVDINTADKALLTEIPGIGPVTAEAILAYRQSNGKFSSIDELTKVKGIGSKTLDKLKPYLQTI